MKDDSINNYRYSAYTVHFWENVLFELGSERVSDYSLGHGYIIETVPETGYNSASFDQVDYFGANLLTRIVSSIPLTAVAFGVIVVAGAFSIRHAGAMVLQVCILQCLVLSKTPFVHQRCISSLLQRLPHIRLPCAGDTQ